MGIFDVSNPPTEPDSDLDPDLTLAADIPINGGTVNVAPGDWVDVDPAAIWPDPTWGLSFQVSNVYADDLEVGILVMDNAMLDTYSEVELSTSWITNNFRRVPKV